MAKRSVVYDGYTYTEREPGDYFQGKPGLLHRIVYAREVGPIPDGWHVHHLDHDRGNNDPTNLQALTASEHALLHMRDKDRAWHVAGALASAAARPERTDTCVRCGTVFTHRHTTTAKFCSPRCKDQGAPSRAHEPRVCSVCGDGYTCPKRNATRTCSPHCRAVAAYAARRPRVRPGG